MASNVLSGYKAGLFVSTTSTAVGAEIGSVRNWTLTVDESMADATSFDSAGWTEVYPVKRGWNVTCEALYLTTSATKQQDELRAALAAGTRKYISLYATTSGQVYKGWAYVGQWTLGGDVNDIAIHGFNVTGDGTLTES